MALEVDDATAIAKGIWLALWPRPSATKRELVNLVRWSLGAGYSTEQIVSAMKVTRSFTIRALEYALRAELAAPKAPTAPVTPFVDQAPFVCSLGLCEGGWIWARESDGYSYVRPCACRAKGSSPCDLPPGSVL